MFKSARGVSWGMLLLSVACSRGGEGSGAAASAAPAEEKNAAASPPVEPKSPPAATAAAGEPGNPGALLGSCAVMGLSCSDYRGGGTAGEIRAQCEKYGGKWSDGACPQAQVQGVCTKVERAIQIVTYSYPPGTAETARTACTNTPGGVFRLP